MKILCRESAVFTISSCSLGTAKSNESNRMERSLSVNGVPRAVIFFSPGFHSRKTRSSHTHQNWIEMKRVASKNVVGLFTRNTLFTLPRLSTGDLTINNGDHMLIV